jgi:DNA-binding CsgD family transcriptional regulator/tetratricopeptide (TPR) repeat protein
VERAAPRSAEPPFEALVAELRRLRRAAGDPSYRTIASALGTTSHTTVAAVLAGARRPSNRLVEDLWRYLGGSPERLHDLMAELSSTSRPSAGPVERSIGMIMNRRTMSPIGTCFQLRPGVLATTADVLDTLNAGIGAEVWVQPLTDDHPRVATITSVDRSRDVAILAAEISLPGSAGPLAVADETTPGSDVEIVSVASPGTGGSATRATLGHWRGTGQVDGQRLGRVAVPGAFPWMRGSPVVRIHDGAIIGMVSGRHNSAEQWLRDSIFVVAGDDLAAAAGPGATNGPDVSSAGPQLRPGRAGRDGVGRTAELASLTSIRAKAVLGTPSTVFIDGDPGVGKSHLLERFIDAARGAGDHVLSGSCLALMGTAVPYAPLIEALQGLVRSYGADATERIVGAAWSDLADMLLVSTDSETRDDTGPWAGSQTRVFAATLRFLDRLTAHRPVILLFEDLQWADPSTLDLVQYLTRMRSSQRLMLLCSHRTDLPARHPLTALLAERNFSSRIERLHLQPFTRGELLEFLRRLGVSDPQQGQQVFLLSEGNAFYAEQLVAGNAFLNLPLLPTSVSHVMLSRLTQLSDPAVQLLRMAAVAGRRVGEGLLSAVSPLPQADLVQALRECTDQQLLMADRVEESYAFRHALLREAVYEDLLPGERRQLHASIATALEASPGLSLLHGAQRDAELAFHWYNAKRKQEALAAALVAASAARAIRAFHEAYQQYTYVLDLWPDDPHEGVVPQVPFVQILAASADTARWAGHIHQAVTLIRRAIDTDDSRTDPQFAGQLHERLGSYLWEAGDQPGSTEAYEQAEALLRDQQPDAVTARVQAALSTVELRKGHNARGLERAMVAVDMAHGSGAIAVKVRALSIAGIALVLNGRVTEAVDHLRQATDIAQAEKENLDLEDLLRAYSNLAFVHEVAGNLSAAAAAAQEGLAITRELGLPTARQTRVLANNGAVALHLLGRWDEATSLLRDALADDPPVAESVYPRLTLAEINVARGNFTDATRLLAEIESVAPDDPWLLVPLYACKAELALLQGDPVTALPLVDRGIDKLSASASASIQLRLSALGLRAAADTGESPDSRVVSRYRSHFEDAFRDSQHTPETAAWLQLCQAELDRVGGQDNAQTWQAVADAWHDLDRPYNAAYAHWRQSKVATTPQDQRAAAMTAHAIATGLGAQPLIAETERLIGAVAATPPSPPVNPFGLTRREREVLQHITAGMTNRQIATTLFITERTASVHVSNILAKLEVRSRSEAAALATRHALVEHP